MYDIIIQNGLVIDGTGAPGRRADVGIAGDRIAAVGSLAPAPARQRIDAHRRIVAPGFIDIHSHSDFIYLNEPLADGKIRQGITTELIGQCGLSGAPMLGAYRSQRQEELAARGISLTWTDLSGYFSRLEETRPLGNLATLVGHGNLRGGVLGYENRPPTNSELGRMKELLEESLQTGAFGLSTGLIYPPGVYSSTEELAELAAVAAGRGGIYATHLRSEGDQLEEAISEALLIAEQTGVSLQIAHLKTYGKRNWHKLPAALGLIEAAQAKGLSVHADRYPYTASFTDLDVLLPAWAWEGGRSATLARLADDRQRRKMTEEIVALDPDPEFWSTVIISSVQNDCHRRIEGQSLEKIAADRGVPPWEALYDLLRDEDLMVTAIFFAMSESNLAQILGQRYVMIGTDSSARSLSGSPDQGKPHPRGFGSFPRILAQWAGPGKLLSWEQAIHKMTGLPAQKLGLPDRGALQLGFSADVVVFDPETVADRADFANPFQPPSGIEHVIVNGESVVHEGALTGKQPGRVLRKK